MLSVWGGGVLRPWRALCLVGPGMMMGGETHYFEFFLRNALSLPKQPLVMILDPGEPSRYLSTHHESELSCPHHRPMLSSCC